MKRVILAASLITAAGFGPLTLGQSAAPVPPTLPSTSTAQPMAVLLEQGVYQEETAGNLDAAAKAYAQIAAQAEVTRSLAAQALLRLAIVQTRQNQMDEAKKTVVRLAEEYPERKDLIAKAQQAVPSAAVAAAPATEAAPPHVPTAKEREAAAKLLAEGWKQLNDGQYRAAQEAFKTASELTPDSAEAYAGTGWSRLDSGDLLSGNAQNALIKAIALDPKNTLALNGMGWFYYKKGQMTDAKDYWLKALEVDPKATSPMSGLAKYASETGRFEEALGWYEKWLKEDPQNADATIGLNKTNQVLAGIKDATAAANDFLKKMDAGQYEEAYRLMSYPAGSSPTAVPIGGGVDQWVAAWKAQRDPLGKMISRTTERSDPGDNAARGGRGGGFGGGDDLQARMAGRVAAQVGRGAGASPYVRVGFIYITQFEHKKSLGEQLIVIKDDTGNWHVGNYTTQETNDAPDPLRAH